MFGAASPESECGCAAPGAGGVEPAVGAAEQETLPPLAANRGELQGLLGSFDAFGGDAQTKALG